MCVCDGIYTDAGVCVFAAYLFHALLGSELVVKGSLSSARLPRPAQTCEDFSVPQWIKHTVQAAPLRL